MPIRLVLLVALLVPSLAAARDGRPAPEDWSTRTKRGATELFKVVLAELKGRRQPCFFEVRWENGRSFSADIARKYLGPHSDAGVVATRLGIGTQDILDPEGAMPGSFCGKDERDRQWKQRMEAFRAGQMPGETDRSGLERLTLRQVELSMPVFDRAFATAVIVVGYHSVGLAKVSPERVRESPESYDANGYARHRTLGGAGYTRVYRKRRGAWVKIFETEDWTAH